MNHKPLLGQPQSTSLPTQPSLTELSLIARYNVFIDNYNKPNCIVDGKQLFKMSNSAVHENVFLLLSDWKGKALCFMLLLIPVLCSLLALVMLYCCFVYYKCLQVHDWNAGMVSDPFKNMVFDPELCFKLRKDYYAFAIQFKELDGFSLNYNKNVRKQFTLREERGHANFLIYNANFWMSYHHFGRWKKQHISWLMYSLSCGVFVNLIFFMYIV